MWQVHTKKGQHWYSLWPQVTAHPTENALISLFSRGLPPTQKIDHTQTVFRQVKDPENVGKVVGWHFEYVVRARSRNTVVRHHTLRGTLVDVAENEPLFS